METHATTRKHRRRCEYGNVVEWERCASECCNGLHCGELPETGLTLRTQLRHGEQRASRCSLGVARSPVHIIFPLHQGIHRPHNTKQMFHLIHMISIYIGGEGYIRMNRLLGFLEVPPQQTPQFSKVQKRSKHAPLETVCQGGKVENMGKTCPNATQIRCAWNAMNS